MSDFVGGGEARAYGPCADLLPPPWHEEQTGTGALRASAGVAFGQHWPWVTFNREFGTKVPHGHARHRHCRRYAIPGE
jgi:hypothetical protein